MVKNSHKAFDTFYLIAHAVNDALDAEIATLRAYRGSGTPGFEREDAESNRQELRKMQGAKAFSEALIVFADKHGELNTLEKERIGFALSTEPNLYDDPPKLSFFLPKPGDMEKLVQRFLSNYADQVELRVTGGKRVNSGEAFDEAIASLGTVPPTSALVSFLQNTPSIRNEMQELAAPAIELRQTVRNIVTPAYRQGEFPESDLMDVSIHFSSQRHSHFKGSPPADFVAIAEGYNQWDSAVRLMNWPNRLLTRGNIATLKNSAAVFEDIANTYAAHSTGTDAWPPMDAKALGAFRRLSYIAGEITEALQSRFVDIAPRRRGIQPVNAADHQNDANQTRRM